MGAGCHVAPSSVDTSTPATTEPPEAAAVPLTVTVAPSATEAPAAGAVTVEVGGVVLVEAAAGARPAIRVAGWASMSARRLIVACCMLRSTAVLPGLLGSRPQAHCTVPAPNTRAPLGARYSERWWVAVWLSATVEP